MNVGFLILFGLGASIFTGIYHYLLSTSVLCSNTEIISNVIPRVCEDSTTLHSEFLFHTDIRSEFPLQLVNLCAILCFDKFDVSCHKYHLNKQLVFTINYTIANTPIWIVVKSVIKQEEDKDAYWHEESESTYIPTVGELRNMVNTYTSSFIGRELDRSFNEINSNIYLTNITDIRVHKQFWEFINDHEFLISYLFGDFRVFPRVVGTCKNLYGVEYAKPLIENPFLPINIPWNTRVNKSIELLRYLKKLQTMWFEPIHLCDVKHDHFGWNSVGDVLFLDLDCVETESSLKNIMVNTPKCANDEDCSYFDCHGHCLSNNHCSEERINTNLQILCSKIFLGNSDSSLLTLAGLLLDVHVNKNLQDALELCASNPEVTVETMIDVLQESINFPQYYDNEL